MRNLPQLGTAEPWRAASAREFPSFFAPSPLALVLLSRMSPPRACPRQIGTPMTPRASCAVQLSLVLFSTPVSAADAVDFAASLIGRPYVWGAEGPGSFDCSGLTQYVYDEFGIELPRRAISQSRVGDPAGSRLRRGDLVFFSSDTRRSLVTHVGIYEGAGMMIDASQRAGRVRRD